MFNAKQIEALRGVEALTAFSTVTVRTLIERGQMAHYSLNASQYPDGALVMMINEQQRNTLLALIEQIEPLIGETMQVNIGPLSGVTGGLVALDANDVPYFLTTVADGYAIAFDANNVPYFDLSRPLITDPFGESSSAVAGFPLPEDLLRLIACVVTLDSDQPMDPAHTVEVLDQVSATKSGYGHQSLKAFVSARRLVPVRLVPTDLWSHVTALGLSLVRCPVIASLDDTITLPDPLMPALTARVTEFLINASASASEKDKVRFERKRQEADAMVMENGIKILESVTTQSVLYVR